MGLYKLTWSDRVRKVTLAEWKLRVGHLGKIASDLPERKQKGRSIDK